MGKDKSATQPLIYFKKCASPVGELYLYANEKELIELSYTPLKGRFETTENLIIKKTILQLAEYFKGSRKTFSIPLAPQGTEFQLKAWKALTQIPYGKTISYRQQAEAIGRKKAFRAVGSANGRNPISIIIPCHRVISSSGKLSGYNGGVDIKSCLLKVEGFEI